LEFKTLRFEEIEAGIGCLTLNRPERLNALSLEMLDELHSFLSRIKTRPEIRVLILTGEGRGFCSGFDLKDERLQKEAARFLSNPGLHLTAVQKKYGDLVVEMRKIPQPIIAAVNGPAAGGGMCLALASDVILAGPKAAFTPSFINIGLSGGEMGTTYFLPRLVGSTRAAEILMTGRTVDAAEAEKIGLVCRAVPEERLFSEALEVARRMIGKTPLGLRFTKEAMYLNSDATLEAAVELENRNQSICCSAPEFLKAVAAFQKR
jgi:enoyl-CoA hydratase